MRRGARSKKAPSGTNLFARVTQKKSALDALGKQGAKIVELQIFVSAASDEPDIGLTGGAGTGSHECLLEGVQISGLGVINELDAIDLSDQFEAVRPSSAGLHRVRDSFER